MEVKYCSRNRTKCVFEKLNKTHTHRRWLVGGHRNEFGNVLTWILIKCLWIVAIDAHLYGERYKVYETAKTMKNKAFGLNMLITSIDNRKTSDQRRGDGLLS